METFYCKPQFSASHWKLIILKRSAFCCLNLQMNETLNVSNDSSHKIIATGYSRSVGRYHTGK